MSKYRILTILSASILLSMSVQAVNIVDWEQAYRKADEKIDSLTLDEKIHFMRGYSSFFFFGVPEKGIPFLYHSDATGGVNIRRNLPDMSMIEPLERSTAMPCPAMLAATFSPELAHRYAQNIGEECRAGGIEILLGPGVNIARNSQCGRNFEYLGEDPFLSSVMASSYIKGMLSTGTAPCLKHFIGNETEFYRRRSNSIIDERAMHEIYLPPFKAGIEAGCPYVMASYNQVNGEWTGQNRLLLKDLLRDELGFRGSVMSDWSSVYDTEKIVLNGINTEMPGRKELYQEVIELLQAGKISEKDIDNMIRPAIATGYAYGLYDRQKYNTAMLDRYHQHVRTAYDVASEGTVLLRNNGILPLKPMKKILVTGTYLDYVPRTPTHPAASAAVEGYDNVSLSMAMRKKFGDNVTFSKNPTIEEIRNADVVIVSLGTEDIESFERPFALPKEQETLAQIAVDNNPNTIILINSGSAVKMSAWNDKSAAILWGWYPGQNGMLAIVDIITGDVNPSGKLPITIERQFKDSPAFDTMPAGAEFYTDAPRAYNEKLISIYDVNYKESVLVGYRWYETKGIAPLYPFGFGLSYTTWELSRPIVLIDGDIIKVKVRLANTGQREGSEVVQVYVTEDKPTVLRPVKELKAFNKVSLGAGEATDVCLEFNKDAISYWDIASHGWKLNPGIYTASIGTSSSDISHRVKFTIK